MIPKFRAWDKENNQMLFPDDTDKIYFEITVDGVVTYDMNHILPDGTFTCLDTGIMQSTGLKDKNGIEIFDGDFLTDGEERWIVRYSETECGFTASGVGKSGCWSLYHLANGKKKGRLIEVIGNKYENPELLKFR